VFIVLMMPDGLAPGLMHLRQRFRKRMASPTIAPPLASQERIDG
jgi:hypothetical protein